MIRRATTDDVDLIMPHLYEFSMGYGTTAQLFPDPDRARGLLTDLVQHEPFWVAEVITLQGERCKILGPDLDATRAVVQVDGYEASNVVPWHELKREIVGVIAGTLGPNPYNDDIVVLQEMFWWVTPAARRGRAGYELLKAFTAYGDSMAHWTVMTLEHNSPVNDRVLTKLGYRMWERNYLRES